MSVMSCLLQKKTAVQGVMLFVLPMMALRLFAEAYPVSNNKSHAVVGGEPITGGSFFVPLPELPDYPAGKIDLGRKLFHEPRLSKNNQLSCASCHSLSTGGVDRGQVSTGVNGAKGVINAPTVFNSSLNFAQFWDGRAEDLEEQVSGPIHNPVEMGTNWKEVIEKLKADTEYSQLFSSQYPDGITASNIADAIATFEKTLLTPSRFDRFLRGDGNALTQQELRGYRLFTGYGCASCHQGVGIGGNLFQLFGVIPGYFEKRPLTTADYGRFNVTNKEWDRYAFKVPGLRNVAITYPYFHDGSVHSLKEAVIIMGRYQLGITLSGSDATDIAAFLGTLTGEWEGKTLE